MGAIYSDCHGHARSARASLAQENGAGPRSRCVPGAAFCASAPFSLEPPPRGIRWFRGPIGNLPIGHGQTAMATHERRLVHASDELEGICFEALHRGGSPWPLRWLRGERSESYARAFRIMFGIYAHHGIGEYRLEKKK